jgi:hypothetical protein
MTVLTGSILLRLVIGLFGLVGIAGVALGPVLGYAIDRLDAWYGALVSLIIGTIFLAVQAGAGGISVAAVTIAAFGFDLSRQSLAVALTARIFGLDPAARSRMNAVLILAVSLSSAASTLTEGFLP